METIVYVKIPGREQDFAVRTSSFSEAALYVAHRFALMPGTKLIVYDQSKGQEYLVIAT